MKGVKVSKNLAESVAANSEISVGVNFKPCLQILSSSIRCICYFPQLFFGACELSDIKDSNTVLA